MKTSKEMARDVLLRRDEYRTKQRQRRKAAGIGLCCLAVALLAGIGIWRAQAVRAEEPSPTLAVQMKEPGTEPVELEYDAAAPLNPDMEPDEWEVDPCPVNEGAETPENTPAAGRENPMEEPSFYEEEPMDELIDELDEADVPDAPHTEAIKERIDGETPPDVGEPRIEPEDGAAAEDPAGLGTIAVDWDYAFYAGSFTDADGQFTVLLTENTAENQEKVCQLHGFDRNTTVFKTAEYDLGYLSSLQAAITERMVSGEFSFIISSSLREDLNRIVVETNTDSAETLRPLLAMDVRGGALVVHTGNRLPGEKPGAVTE